MYNEPEKELGTYADAAASVNTYYTTDDGTTGYYPDWETTEYPEGGGYNEPTYPPTGWEDETTEYPGEYEQPCTPPLYEGDTTTEYPGDYIVPDQPFDGFGSTTTTTTKNPNGEYKDPDDFSGDSGSTTTTTKYPDGEHEDLEDPIEDWRSTTTTTTIPPKLIPVEKITLSVKKKILSVGETLQLVVTVAPENASNRVVFWSSSPAYVASVKNGLVTAKEGGTTIITARTANGCKATCEITVDTRPVARIEQESIGGEAYFTVWFEEGGFWKNIGCDIEANKSGVPLWNSELYDSLYEHERRYLDNVNYNRYTVSQLAFLYMLDPLGVEYYVCHDACEGMQEIEALRYKDHLYQTIFGTLRFFEAGSGDKLEYKAYIGYPMADTLRDIVFSEAEILFGAHVPTYTLIDFVKDGTTIILKLFYAFLDSYGLISIGIQAYQALFFSGSFTGIGENMLSTFWEYDFDNAIWVTKTAKIFNTVNTVLQAFANRVDKQYVSLDSSQQLISGKIATNSYYRVICIINGEEISMEDGLDDINTL